MEISLSPLETDPGPVVSAAIRDITKARLAQRELARQRDALEIANQDLARSNSELEQFASVASHDLQEPLRKLVSFSELLRADLGGDLSERASQDLEFITDAAKRMRTLVRDLLTLSRTGTSEMKYAGVARQVRGPRARCARPPDLRDARRDHARSASRGGRRCDADRGAVSEPALQRAEVRAPRHRAARPLLRHGGPRARPGSWA